DCLLLSEVGLRYNDENIPRRADRALDGCGAGEGFAWRQDLTARFWGSHDAPCAEARLAARSGTATFRRFSTAPPLRRGTSSTLRDVPPRDPAVYWSSARPSRNSPGPVQFHPTADDSWPGSTGRRRGPSPAAPSSSAGGSRPPRGSCRRGNGQHPECWRRAHSLAPSARRSRPGATPPSPRGAARAPSVSASPDRRTPGPCPGETVTAG